MAWKKFAYSISIFDYNTGESISQPTLAAKILPRSEYLPFKTRMVVDSGADETLLDADIGKAIGIDVPTGIPKRVGGVTGFTIGYEHRVQIELTELGDILNIDVIFVPEMGASGLLGQKDFFSAYNVFFEKSKLKFGIEKVSTLASDF